MPCRKDEPFATAHAPSYDYIEVIGMIQVKEFVDTDTRLAEKSANEFLATLDDKQLVDIRYGSIVKQDLNKQGYQRSSILIIYKTTKTTRASANKSE